MVSKTAKYVKSLSFGALVNGLQLFPSDLLDVDMHFIPLMSLSTQQQRTHGQHKR